MSSISRTQALTISHADVLGSYIKTLETDQLLPRIPKMAVRGDSLQVADVATLATASFVTSGGTADASATDYDTPARSYPLRRVPTRVEVNGAIAQNVSMISDVFEQQIEAKMIAMWSAVGSKLIYGTGVDPEPAGLQTLAALHPSPPPGLGTGITLAALDDLISRIRPWDGDTPRAFVMNRGQYAKVTAAARAAGLDLDVRTGAGLGRPLAHYMGVPLLVSDYILDTEAGSTTSIYLVILGPRAGEPQFGGLVWCYNDTTGAGIKVDGPHRTSATTDVMFATLDLNIAFASLSTGSVVRLSGVTP